MQDVDCVRFLQWALPRMQMRWAGFRKVRNQVCKRLSRRLTELELANIEAYQQLLTRQPDEWQKLDSLCRVVVTRFYRDKLVFTRLTENLLPQLAVATSAEGRENINIWNIGSASGEEAYTLAILWQQLLAPHFTGLKLAILGTEIEISLLKRSQKACYAGGTIKNLPPALRSAAFNQKNDDYCLKPQYQAMVEFRQQDIRTELPDKTFDLILCRNLVFTYFDESLQQTTLQRMLTRLRPGGWLIVGVRERLPAGAGGLTVVSERLGFYQR
ncbi:CheR family methyltransferase [Methylophaga sp. OBS4]|uniref:CheR family methyltransferase n=1 Tax=Methylophaga sp. OBS4 TaxID=2991935 RepID=UPI00225C38F4|nr:CheR family methyltransferase [Methylophaga sp. OBS4]MCX4186896.1 methyltransferase domain-containing protein [Methylophaga sp. OBS4]